RDLHSFPTRRSSDLRVADAVPLVANTKEDGYDSSNNPYAAMFASASMNNYSEVILWRQYDPTKGINHNVNHYINQNGGNTGYTRSEEHTSELQSREN